MRRFLHHPALALLLFPLLLAACGTSVNTLNAAAFADEIQKPGVMVIDVRTPAEFRSEHIEGALNIDVEGGSFEVEIASLDPSRMYALYCRSGRRSAVAADIMTAAGFATVYHLEGGVIAWQQAGYPLSS